MRKYLPFIFLLLGIFIIVGVFFVVKNRNQPTINEFSDSGEEIAELSLEKKPVVSLTPTSDGHYLNLRIDKIEIDGASTLDYELIYKLASGISQGVPGTVDVKGKKEFEAEILLGSESSGKFRYDKGVEGGTLTLRFRNDKGKLIAKFSTDFNLFGKTQKLISPDGEFNIELDKALKNEFVVLMNTVGIFSLPPKEVSRGPYGVFSSGDLNKLKGKIKLGEGKIYMHTTGPRWEEFSGEQFIASDSGIFVGTVE